MRVHCNICFAHTPKGAVLRLTRERSWHRPRQNRCMLITGLNAVSLQQPNDLRYQEWTLTQPRNFDHSGSGTSR